MRRLLGGFLIRLASRLLADDSDTRERRAADAATNDIALTVALTCECSVREGRELAGLLVERGVSPVAARQMFASTTGERVN
jgi:hypothetical protein